MELLVTVVMQYGKLGISLAISDVGSISGILELLFLFLFVIFGLADDLFSGFVDAIPFGGKDVRGNRNLSGAISFDATPLGSFMGSISHTNILLCSLSLVSFLSLAILAEAMLASP